MAGPTDTAELERQLERSSMFTQATLQKLVTQITDTRDVLAELVRILQTKGILETDDDDAGPVPVAVEEPPEPEEPGPADTPRGSRPSMEGGDAWHWPAVALGVDAEGGSEPVNCAERLHVCQAVCCKLSFALTGPEVDAGKVRWDLGFPYHIRHDVHGMCVHHDANGGGCTVYADRPGVCRRYSCKNDGRIWKDFEAMELNHEWLDANLGHSEKIRVSGGEPGPD